MARPRGPRSLIPNETRLVDAAIRCIGKSGVAKTFLDDIGREAGLSRPTVYRTFGSRKQLLESVAARSIGVFKTRMRIRLRKYPTFREALVSGIVDSLDIASKDPVFMATLEALGDEGMERYFLDPSGPNFAYTLEAYAETLARARTAGLVRGGITDHELISLICSFSCIFLLRDDMDRAARETFLRKFLLPAVMPDRVLTGTTAF